MKTITCFSFFFGDISNIFDFFLQKQWGEHSKFWKFLIPNQPKKIEKQVLRFFKKMYVFCTSHFLSFDSIFIVKRWGNNRLFFKTNLVTCFSCFFWLISQKFFLAAKSAKKKREAGNEIFFKNLCFWLFSLFEF